MRVVIATPLYPPEIGGPATYAKLLSEGLPERGIEVEVVKFSEVRHLPKFLRHVMYFWRVLKATRRSDAVLALDPVSVGLPAMLAARIGGKPFVVKIVGDYAWEQGRQRFGVSQSLDAFVKEKHVPSSVRTLRRVQSCVARKAVRIIVPSAYLQSVVAAWGIPQRKVEVIYNAATIGVVGAVPDSVTRLVRPVVIGSLGRLVPWKGVDGVIDAATELRHKHVELSLVIAGDGPERAALIERAEQEMKIGYVFTGSLAHPDALALMKYADVLVLNSTYEGLSHLLIEAQALGVPTIATRAGGNAEVITDGEDGLLVPPNDTPALAQALERILSDGKLRAHLSAQAQKSAERFSEEAMLSATTHFFKNL
jgi:glycosyltransferase involved in cell wall biosynthesis